MRIARVEDESGKRCYVLQQPDGTLLYATLGADEVLCPTSELVTPYRWLPPIVPVQIFCIGRNYAAHAAEGGAPPPEYPILFMKNIHAAIGHLEPIRLPRVCGDEVDFEGELVVVIGKTGKNIPLDQALDYVFGYTIGHDVSARIWQEQKGGSQWCRGKSFDTFAPLGPVLVTANDIPDPSVLEVNTKLNGEPVQHGRVSDMIFDIPTLIHFLSQDTTLMAGTVIMTGTPPGVGWARDPKLTLKPGDLVEIEIPGIGSLRNSVIKA